MAAPGGGEPPRGDCFHYWKKGECDFGERCKYLHNLTPPPAGTANPATSGLVGGAWSAGSGGWDATAGGGSALAAPIVLAQEALVPAHTLVLAFPAIRIGEPPKGVCFDMWRTGVCKVGVSCCYSHQTDSAPAPARAPPPIAQQRAATGGLSAAQAAEAQVSAQTSASAFPAAPGHAHTPARANPPPGGRGGGGNGAGGGGGWDGGAAPIVFAHAAPLPAQILVPAFRVGEPPKGVCFDMWRTGVCKRGVSCLYSHHTDSAPAHPPSIAQQRAAPGGGTIDPGPETLNSKP